MRVTKQENRPWQENHQKHDARPAIIVQIIARAVLYRRLINARMFTHDTHAPSTPEIPATLSDKAFPTPDACGF